MQKQTEPLINSLYYIYNILIFFIVYIFCLMEINHVDIQ